MGADTDPSNEVVKAQAKAFEEQYPGTKIDLQFVAWTQAHDKFTTAIAGQKTPDVAEIGSTWTPEFAATGAFAEQPAPPEGQYLSALQDAGTLDGKFYGLPWYAGARALFYRTDVFEELGITPPTTWDEWLAAMQKIKDAGEIDPFGAATVQDGMHMFLPLVWQAGGEIATNEGGEWVSKMDTPEAVQGLDLWAKIYQEGYSPEGVRLVVGPRRREGVHHRPGRVVHRRRLDDLRHPEAGARPEVDDRSGARRPVRQVHRVRRRQHARRVRGLRQQGPRQRVRAVHAAEGQRHRVRLQGRPVPGHRRGDAGRAVPLAARSPA